MDAEGAANSSLWPANLGGTAMVIDANCVL